MEVVWNGRSSLHDLFVSQRDQLLFQVRGYALGEHAPALAPVTTPKTNRRAGPGRGHKLPASEKCAACGGPMERKYVSEGRVRCQPCGRKWRLERSAAKAQLELNIQRLRADGMTIHQIVKELHTSMRMVYRALQEREVQP